jgi:hypothetical protein
MHLSSGNISSRPLSLPDPANFNRACRYMSKCALCDHVEGLASIGGCVRVDE